MNQDEHTYPMPRNMGSGNASVDKVSCGFGFSSTHDRVRNWYFSLADGLKNPSDRHDQ